jgi:sugar transferase (PEP-CTERM system associated)
LAATTPSTDAAPPAVTPAPRAAPARRAAFPALLVRLVVAGTDALLVALALLAATAIRIPLERIEIDPLPGQLGVCCGLMIVGLARHGAYEFQHLRNGQELLSRLALGSMIGLGLIMLASYVLPDVAVGRGVFVLHGLIAVPLLLVWRRFLFRTLRESALRPRAVVLGEAAVARKVAAALSTARFGGAEVAAILTPDEPPPPAPLSGEADPAPMRGTYAQLAEIVHEHGVTQAIVIAGAHDEHLPLDEIIALRREGLEVEDGSAAYEGVTGKLLIEKLTPGWLVFANAFEKSAFERRLRRAVGFFAAATALVLLSPLLLLVAIAVRLESPGPVIFRQRRTGENGRPFELLKFRTMREDAEKGTGAVWAKVNDPRVTRIGGFLRSTRLDELPQLWNVLRGDMFFVGPRPERPEFVEILRKEIPHYDQRHRVKPGITGWAQINYRYGASVDDAAEKLHYDLYYIQNLSLLLDLDIIIGTIRVMLGAENKN